MIRIPDDERPPAPHHHSVEIIRLRFFDICRVIS